MITDEKAAFWIVWSPTGGKSVVRHPSVELAVAEAARLSQKHRDRHFYVLGCIGYELTTKEADSAPVDSSEIELSLRKGAIVHVDGIPVSLKYHTRVRSNRGNLPMISDDKLNGSKAKIGESLGRFSNLAAVPDSTVAP